MGGGNYASRKLVPPPIRHDANGNRATKTTSFGSVRYWYDKENRLVHSGSDAGRGTDYIYDKNGNLIEKKNLYKTDFYSYTGSNRMKSSVIEDHKEKTKTITRYDYDALGRRTLVQDEGSTLMRTLYDGMSFDIIREQESFADGYFTNTSDTYVDWQTSGGESSSRYRYIGEEAGSQELSPASGENQANSQSLIPSNFYANNGENQANSSSGNSGNFHANSTADYRLVSPNRSRSSVTLFAKGEAVATNKNSYSTTTTSSSSGNRSGTTSASTKRSYFGTDMIGSVRSSTHDDGLNANYYDYDVFGKPFGETSDYGYVGKPYDPVTGLSNYGYRDYSPKTARFTTVDPIRDGHNWYAYCSNDPVNFVDLWGLAPRNMSEEARDKYKKAISSYMDYNKDNNDKGLPKSYDCADVATYLYNEGMTAAGDKTAMKKLEHNGKSISTAPEMQSKDYFPENINNISFYDDKSFNNPNIEVGTVAVWKGPGVDKDGKGWIGHVATVIDVTRDENGNVISITTIEGHTGGNKTKTDVNSAAEWATYQGEFLGFGEIGKDATIKYK